MEETENKKTTELGKVKPTKVTLMIHGKEREIKFGFSAWAKLEEEYDGLKNLSKMEEQLQNKPFQIIPHLMYISLVDKEGVTEENILDDYGLGDIPYVTEVLKKALYGSLPSATSEEKKTEVTPKA